MPFRHVAFFIKCRARGCGICSWAAGGRNCSERNALILSAAAPKNGARDHRSRQKSREVSEFCLPHPPKPRGLVSCHIGKCCQNQPARGPSSQRLIQMQQRITAASKSTGFYKKRTAENRTVLEMCRVYLFLSY